MLHCVCGVNVNSPQSPEYKPSQYARTLIPRIRQICFVSERKLDFYLLQDDRYSYLYKN